MSEKTKQLLKELVLELGLTEFTDIMALYRVVGLLSRGTVDYTEHYTDYDQSIWKIEIVISTKDYANQLFKSLKVGA